MIAVLNAHTRPAKRRGSTADLLALTRGTRRGRGR